MRGAALLEKLVEVLREFARQQVEAGADVIQIFDSWVGCAERRGLSGIRTARSPRLSSATFRPWAFR